MADGGSGTLPADQIGDLGSNEASGAVIPGQDADDRCPTQYSEVEKTESGHAVLGAPETEPDE